jgi:hypothetical protein
VLGCLQVRGSRAHAEEDARLIDGDGPLPVGEGGFFDREQVAQAGVVDQNVKTAELVNCFGARGLPVGFTGDVVQLERRLRAGVTQLGAGGLTSLLVDVGDEDSGALLREPHRCCLADATGRPR